MNKPDKEDKEEMGEDLCEICGSVKVIEDGKLICSHCDTTIDYFGDDDEDDTK